MAINNWDYIRKVVCFINRSHHNDESIAGVPLILLTKCSEVWVIENVVLYKINNLFLCLPVHWCVACYPIREVYLICHHTVIDKQYLSFLKIYFLKL